MAEPAASPSGGPAPSRSLFSRLFGAGARSGAGRSGVACACLPGLDGEEQDTSFRRLTLAAGTRDDWGPLLTQSAEQIQAALEAPPSARELRVATPELVVAARLFLLHKRGQLAPERFNALMGQGGRALYGWPSKLLAPGLAQHLFSLMDKSFRQAERQVNRDEAFGRNLLACESTSNLEQLQAVTVLLSGFLAAAMDVRRNARKEQLAYDTLAEAVEVLNQLNEATSV